MIYNNELLRRDLLLDTAQNYKACLRIANSEKDIVSFIIFQYLPYLSLNILDIIDKFDIDNIDEVYTQRTDAFTSLLSINRNFLKTATEFNKYSKVKNQLLKHIKNNYNSLIFDYNNDQKCYVKNFGQKDLSVFSYNGLPFLNNIQNQQFISRFTNEHKRILGEDLMVFSSSVSNFIQYISNISLYDNNTYEPLDERIQNNKLNFDMNDYFLYEESRSDIFKNELEADQNIFLFNLLCQVNSVSYIYPDVIKLEGNVLLRMKFIVYLILIKGIWIYAKDNNLPEEFKLMVEASDQIFINDKNRSGFRNSIFHYDVPQGAKYKKDIINTLVEYYLKLEVSDFEEHVDNIFYYFVKEINILLFGEQKLFLGSNVL